MVQAIQIGFVYTWTGCLICVRIGDSKIFDINRCQILLTPTSYNIRINMKIIIN